MESLSFDTTFLIDFQRERKAGKEGRAHQFLVNHAEKGAYLSVIAYGEYAEGFEDPYDPSFISVVESFEIIDITRKTAEHYARITRKLRNDGHLIGSNDLWIAAVALENSLPLVTDNSSHFARVPDLRVFGY
ncbi:MAG: type II toxin-antitoxin system VapC family toxin [Verrucomicrobiales bacterium]